MHVQSFVSIKRLILVKRVLIVAFAFRQPAGEQRETLYHFCTFSDSSIQFQIQSFTGHLTSNAQCFITNRAWRRNRRTKNPSLQLLCLLQIVGFLIYWNQSVSHQQIQLCNWLHPSLFSSRFLEEELYSSSRRVYFKLPALFYFLQRSFW